MSNWLPQHGTTLEHAIWLALTEKSDDLLFIRKFAKSVSLTANVEADIWGYTSNKVFLTASELHNVVSASANDTVAGTGARYVLINGLDNDYNLIYETVALNGTTPVSTTKKYLRIYNARVVAAGSGKVNAGAITLTASSAGTVQEYIPIGESVSHSSHMTCPAGYSAIAIDTNFSIYRASGGSGIRRGEMHIYAELPIPVLGGSVKYATAEYGLGNDGTGVVSLRPNIPGQVPEKMDLWYSCTAETTGTYATVQFTWLLIKDTFTTKQNLP